MAVENLVSDVMANINAPRLEEDDVEGGFYKHGARLGPFLAKVVTMAKAEHGLKDRTEANQLMIRKFCLDIMKDKGMRPTHIAQHLDIIVAIFFIPSDVDIVKRQIGATYEAVNRDGLIKRTWTSAYRAVAGMLNFNKE